MLGHYHRWSLRDTLFCIGLASFERLRWALSPYVLCFHSERSGTLATVALSDAARQIHLY